MDWLLALLLGYALGSVPFGLLLAKAAGKGDIRQVGSGNIGATNVLRTGNKWLAAAVLLLDAGKGFLAVWLAASWWPDDAVTPAAAPAAMGAVLGHCLPVWLAFKGGKGVATTLGVCLGLGYPIGLAYAAVWLAMLAITRISSIGGMSAAIAAPVAAAVTGYGEFVPDLMIIAFLVLLMHGENIARLRAGIEPKIGRKK